MAFAIHFSFLISQYHRAEVLEQKPVLEWVGKFPLYVSLRTPWKKRL